MCLADITNLTSAASAASLPSPPPSDFFAALYGWQNVALQTCLWLAVQLVGVPLLLSLTRYVSRMRMRSRSNLLEHLGRKGFRPGPPVRDMAYS